MISTATLSSDRAYRYRLDRHWDDRVAPALFVMLNPSTADADEDDATIRRCIGFAKLWKCGGLTVVNLYALRSTDPKKLRTHPAPVGPENDAHVIAAAHRADLVVCAWGAGSPSQLRAAKVMQIILEHGRRLTCLGKTAGGHPRHPLYVPSTRILEPYP